MRMGMGIEIGREWEWEWELKWDENGRVTLAVMFCSQ